MKKVLSFISAILLISVVFVGCSLKSVEPTEPAQTESVTEATEAPTQTPTEKDTQAPTEKPTEKPTEVKKDESWKKLYINQLNSLSMDEYMGFCLVQIDDNDVPELYAESISHMVNSHLYWVQDNEICDYPMHYSGLSYIKRGNLFLNSGGFQGACFDDVVSIDKNTTKLIAQGEYFLPELTGFESYKWNDVEMSQSDYEAAKNSAINTKSVTKPDMYYSYSDICEQITQW